VCETWPASGCPRAGAPDRLLGGRIRGGCARVTSRMEVVKGIAPTPFGV
jgi:hypothetical protein